MNNYAEDSSSGIGVGSIVGNKFRLEEKLGQGSFGMIFKCINLDNQEVYAIKMEKRNQRHSSMLVREIKVMMELKTEFGYARMITYGKDDDHNFVVMTSLGKNLDSILKKCGQRFSLATCMNIADQMITRLEVLHNHNLIHRDIKPENFVIGPDRGFNQIYLIDFGLAKYYKDSEGNHIPMVEKKGMIGTARYASINAHQGYEQSRRDDLEALGYVFLYFIRGKLPWQQIYAETKDEKYEKIKNMKMNYPLEQLCEGCPNELVQYLRIVKKLEFQEQPNYAQLKALFKKVVTDKKLETQSQNVDWETLPDYRHKKKLQAVSDLPPIPTQKEIALRQQQMRQQQMLQQQLLAQQQQQTQTAQKETQQNTGDNDNKKKQRNSILGNQIGVQLDSKGLITPNQTQINPKTKTPQTQQNIEQSKNIDMQKSNPTPNAAASNNNIQISPPNGAAKTNSQQNVVQSPETGKFGGESRSNVIKDSELEKIISNDKLNNKGSNSNGGQQLINREVSVSILNNNPNFQYSSHNNSINGQHTNNNSPVNNPNSSTLIPNFPEKRNSFHHPINHSLAHNNSNLLNVPAKDQASISITSLTGTSKLNNYSGSDSDTIVDEGGIQISNMMIDKNMSPLTTSDIRKDIRTRSLVIRQSQLEIGELDMNRIQDHNSSKSKQFHSLNQFQNNVTSILKFDSSHAAIDVQSKIENSPQRDFDSVGSPNGRKSQSGLKKQQNGHQQENQYSYSHRQNGQGLHKNISSSLQQIASAEEIKDHQDDENNSNTKNIKNYKTQFTPITEVKESTYKSFKTKTSKASFIGENVTESMYENPIMINVMPIKRAFLRKK